MSVPSIAAASTACQRSLRSAEYDQLVILRVFSRSPTPRRPTDPTAAPCGANAGLPWRWASSTAARIASSGRAANGAEGCTGKTLMPSGARIGAKPSPPRTLRPHPYSDRCPEEHEAEGDQRVIGRHPTDPNDRRSSRSKCVVRQLLPSSIHPSLTAAASHRTPSIAALAPRRRPKMLCTMHKKHKENRRRLGAGHTVISRSQRLSLAGPVRCRSV